MVYPVVTGGNDDFFQEPHFVDMPGVVPELSKQLKRGNRCNHLFRNTQQGSRQEQYRKHIKKGRNTLPKGAGQVIFLTAVVDYMQVPEQINLMTPAVHPVPVKINDNKGQNVDQDGILNMGQGQILQHKGIDPDGNGDLEHTLGYIGNTRTQGGNHVHIPDRIKSLSPAPPFFKSTNTRKAGMAMSSIFP